MHRCGAVIMVEYIGSGSDMSSEIYNKKILLVDDEIPILNMIEVVLKKENFSNVFRANTGKNAIEKCEEISPDIIILDVMLPDMEGYEVCRLIREKSMVPILFLSARSEEMDRIISFKVGGDDYIMKPFSPKELVARVSAMLRRQNFYENKGMSEHTNQIAFGNCVIDLEKRELYVDSKLVEMPAKEYFLLEYMVENRNITLSKEKIISRVWGYEYDGYDNTVMVHIRRIREKIEKEPSNPRYLVTVKGRGYRFEI